MDGEEEQDAEHDGGKAGTHAAPLLLAELVGQRWVMAKDSTAYRTLSIPETAWILTLPKKSLYR